MHACPYGFEPVHLPNGDACRSLPDVDCGPPTVRVCSATVFGPLCRCEVPRPLICEARIEFPSDNPAAATLSATLPGCELAIAAIAAALAKLLMPIP